MPLTPPYVNYLYLGVELEVECAKDERGYAASALAEQFSSKLLLKEDGSLNNGFKLVTGKMSLEMQQTYWPKFAKVAVQAGARSWKHQSTGLHVHLSRDFFTPLHVGKFLVFINSPLTKANIVRLAGRNSPDYAALKKKKLTDGIKQSERRYEAVNLQNDETIEVRIFKGTLNAAHILADIEFCHAVALWSKDVSIADCESWTSFHNFVEGNKKQYARLFAYITRPAHVRSETGQFIAANNLQEEEGD